MYKRISILSLSLLGCFLFSCQPQKSSSSSGVGKQTGTNKQGASAATGTGGKTTETSSSGSSGGDLSSLESLLGGMMGGNVGAGGGASGPESGVASADPNAVLWDEHFKDPFLSFQLHELQQNSDTFSCPGDSLIVGFQSLYDKTKGDRQMQPYCQFYVDGTGRPMMKQNCSVTNAMQAGVDAKEFLCPKGTLLSGFRSAWNVTKMDRSYDFECCELANQEGTKMDFITTQDPTTNLYSPVCERYPGSATSQSNHLMGVLDFRCQGAVIDMQTGQGIPAGTSVRNIISSYMEHKVGEGEHAEIQNDRVWAMECCVMGVPTPVTDTTSTETQTSP
jgi:hypothetical protein